ncbi:hypothetical protein IMSAGC019_03923 [Lachnospiraceae bacterium]|nr:hypothetical protein IMSAGC019_03923 [Lachnospiraceae bacterium]
MLMVMPLEWKFRIVLAKKHTSLTYKIIVWKQIDGKSGTEFYIFPNNFHQLDYYRK